MAIRATLSAVTGRIDLVSLVERHPGVVELARAAISARRIVASGVGGSAVTLVAAAVARATGRPVVLVTAHIDDADEARARSTGSSRAARAITS